jgi:hypothetical protein
MTSFLLAGVGAAYLAGLVIPARGLDPEDPHGTMDAFARWLVHQDWKVLPVAALLIVLALAALAHVIAKLFDRWQSPRDRKLGDSGNLPGRAEDSVNAALGFAAVAIPLTTLMLLGLLALASPALEQRIGQAALVAVLSGLLVLYLLAATLFYLVMSFAAVHNVSWGRAAVALATAYVCAGVIVTIVA